MPLLNVRTRKHEEFFNKPAPNYAILSHTWGEDEIVYQDFQENDSMLRLLREMQYLLPSSTQLSSELGVPRSRTRDQTTLIH